MHGLDWSAVVSQINGYCAAVIWVTEKSPTIAYIDILTCVLTFVFEEDI